MPAFRIPLSDLRPHVYPLDGQMWRCGPIDPAEVLSALKGDAREHRQWETVVNTMGLDEARRFHVLRVATLTEMPSFDRIVVIAETHVDPPKVYLNDGNHRLAAAFLKGDEFIDALVAPSVPNSELQVFPNATPL